MMSETTAAEVMGLSGGCNCGGPPACECWSGPTPDDMLAWLREQEAATYHHGDTTEGFDAGLASSTHRITVVKAGLHTIRTEAPTLRAALDLAVIAVGRKADQ